MFNSFNDFYSKMSQSFIDYLKHIFGDAPKPPKPDLPKLPPRPKTSSIYEYINIHEFYTVIDFSFFKVRIFALLMMLTF